MKISMEWVAVILALGAFILFILAAKLSAPPAWHYGWLGCACLTASLAIWHVVAGLKPLVNK